MGDRAGKPSGAVGFLTGTAGRKSSAGGVSTPELQCARVCAFGATLVVTVAILAQGTKSGDALCAALFYAGAVRVPFATFRFLGRARFWES